MTGFVIILDKTENYSSALFANLLSKLCLAHQKEFVFREYYMCQEKLTRLPI